MGTSHGDFIKYPRTPHLFGSKGTDDDKHLGEAESSRFIADDSLIVEEKIDGTNVGIHFSVDGKCTTSRDRRLIQTGSMRRRPAVGSGRLFNAQMMKTCGRMNAFG